ncbi:hypothetical protein PR048_031047 [Dryococelus australis]|uniref:Uncharacterized protein n=1 Tax=Dryococelus australis TaxID=614101 RepID=A0ABQ9G458_9NEOP|nr:hypothetical protein PR048_031047 [Dryococelus australis]
MQHARPLAPAEPNPRTPVYPLRYHLPTPPRPDLSSFGGGQPLPSRSYGVRPPLHSTANLPSATINFDRGLKKREIPEKTRRPAASPDTISTQIPGATPPGIEPGFALVGGERRKIAAPRESPPAKGNVSHISDMRKRGCDTAGYQAGSDRRLAQPMSEGAAVVEWSDYPPPTWATRVRFPDFRMQGIMPDDAAGPRGFLGDLSFTPPLHSGAAPFYHSLYAHQLSSQRC